VAEAVTAGLGRVLVSRGLLDDTSLRAALEGKPGGAAFIARLLAAGTIGEPELLEALSEFLGMPAVDLSRTAIDLSVLDTVPRHVAEADRMLPLSREGGRLHIAVDGTGYSQQTLDEVQFVTDCWSRTTRRCPTVSRAPFSPHTTPAIRARPPIAGRPRLPTPRK